MVPPQEDYSPLTPEDFVESQDVINLELAEALSNAREFNPYMTCNSSIFDSVVERLISEMRTWYLDSIGSRFRSSDNLNMLVRILTNLAFNSIISPEKYLSVPFSRQFYTTNTRYQPSFGSQRCAKQVREFLERSNLIEHHRGFQDRSTGNSRLTRIRATSRLHESFREIYVEQFQSNRYQEPLILRDVNKQPVEYNSADFPFLHFWRQDITLINELIADSWIDLFVPDTTYRELCNRSLDLTRTTLCRIFNNSSFELHGRFYYGWWQEIESQYRQFITINGEQTTELDYSSMNVALLYAESGLTLPSGDLYQVADFTRQDCKLAFNIMLNSESRASAVRAAIGNNSEIELSAAQVNELLDALEEKHNQLSTSFYSGVANRLMFKESKIANLLMLRLAEQDVVTLPIHDGFIVQQRHSELLREMMMGCFRTITDGNVNVPPPVASISEPLDFDAHFDEYSMYYERQTFNED